MTDIIDMANTKPADLSVSVAQQGSDAQDPNTGTGRKQPVREAIIRAAELARGAEEHARDRQHAKGKHTARERLDLLFATDTFQELGRFAGGDIAKG
ncbi:MAG: methylmalonyl-CoA carboxyltransferase, partial [Bifidobacterium psychraerophilum]